MPIAVKDFTWEETDKHVFITVPLKGVQPSKVDIFSTEVYIKVSYPPYIFESFLFAPVYDEASAAEVGNGAVVFKLEKMQPAIWSQLQISDIDDKLKLMELRQAAVQRHQERSAQRQKERDERKREADQLSVRQQIELEQEARDRIENMKISERKKATEELDKWKEEQRQQALKEKAELEERLQKEEATRQAEIQARLQQEQQQQPKSAKHKKLRKKEDIFSTEGEGSPMRDGGKISVSFTPRVFPTAARESTHREEQEWLQKQADARRMLDAENADLSEQERDPVWLRDKGNEFFKKGDYQSAINAFSHAIRLNSTLPAIYSNRAACHLRIGNYFKCIEDCSRALELLTPPVAQNAASRCRAHVRRGTAFCELELYTEGLMDYDVALKLDPNNEQLQADADRIRKIIQGPGPQTS